MPTYEYTCNHCQHTLEIRQKITDEPLITCPICQKLTLQRGVGGGNCLFQFIGGGFYGTDYKKGKDSGCSSVEPCHCKQEES